MARLCEAVQTSRFFNGFFQLADFFFDLPGYLFADTFSFQLDSNLTAGITSLLHPYGTDP